MSKKKNKKKNYALSPEGVRLQHTMGICSGIEEALRKQKINLPTCTEEQLGLTMMYLSQSHQSFIERGIYTDTFMCPMLQINILNAGIIEANSKYDRQIEYYDMPATVNALMCIGPHSTIFWYADEHMKPQLVYMILFLPDNVKPGQETVEYLDQYWSDLFDSSRKFNNDKIIRLLVLTSPPKCMLVQCTTTRSRMWDDVGGPFTMHEYRAARGSTYTNIVDDLWNNKNASPHTTEIIDFVDWWASNTPKKNEKNK